MLTNITFFLFCIESTPFKPLRKLAGMYLRLAERVMSVIFSSHDWDQHNLLFYRYSSWTWYIIIQISFRFYLLGPFMPFGNFYFDCCGLYQCVHLELEDSWKFYSSVCYHIFFRFLTRFPKINPRIIHLSVLCYVCQVSIF